MALGGPGRLPTAGCNDQPASKLAEAARVPREPRQHLTVDVEGRHLRAREGLQKPESVEPGARPRVERPGAGGQAPLHALQELLDAALESEQAQRRVVGSAGRGAPRMRGRGGVMSGRGAWR